MLKPTSKLYFIFMILIVLTLYLLYNSLNTDQMQWIQHEIVKVKEGVFDNLDTIQNMIPKEGLNLDSSGSLEVGITSPERRGRIDVNGSVGNKTFHDSLLEGKRLKNNSMFVIVMAQMRTGSSIVGQMFNQNRGFFYFFEPLYPVNVLIYQKVIRTKQRWSTQLAILHDISRCRFSASFVQIMKSWGGRNENRALAPFCQSKATCMWSPSLIQQVCEQHRNRLAIKSIRADLEHLPPLVEDYGVDVRVIHLVRDPRGTANSRLQYELVKSYPEKHNSSSKSISEQTSDIFKRLLQKSITRLCERMVQNAGEAAKDPSWLKGRYTQIRYEDFALSPVKTTRKIYDFLGLELPGHVKVWLKKATEENAGKDRRVTLFSQHKNAKAAAAKWKYTLSGIQIRQIENTCEEAMRLYGYRRLYGT